MRFDATCEDIDVVTCKLDILNESSQLVKLVKHTNRFV